jgi:uncharacterized protein (TIGR02453 family)
MGQDPEGFEVFPAAGLQFLVDLRANNNRDWFTANKGVLDRELMAPARAFCAELQSFLRTLTGEPYAAKIWRMHRDLRFSKDKTPYNTHLHISLAPEDAPAGAPGWFFGLDTEKISLGSGTFAFEPAQLEAFRTKVLAEDGATIASRLAELTASGVRLSKPELKQVPRGYDRAHPRAHLLRHKGFAAWIELADRGTASRADFAQICCAAFERLRPVYDICRV